MSETEAISRDGIAGGQHNLPDPEEAKIGMVPTILGRFENAAAALNAFRRFSNEQGSGRLSPRQQKVIAMAVAELNAHHYVLSASVDENTGQSNESFLPMQAEYDDASMNAIANVAITLLKRAGQLSDSDISGARAAGIDDEVLTEIFGNVALCIMAGYAHQAVPHFASEDETLT